MKVAVLGGGGLMGRVIARTLVERLDSDVIVADYDLAAAEEVVDWIGSERATAVQVDVTEKPALVKLISAADAVANAVTYYFNLRVMEACLEAKVPYADLGGFFHGTRKQLELNDAYAKAGVTGVVCIGSAPGITNVQARLGADQLTSVESVRLLDGAIPFESEGIVWGYSLATVLDELTENPQVYRGGAWIEMEPLAELESYQFRAPIGQQTIHHSLHSEVATIPVSFAGKGVKDVEFKINYFGLSPKVIERLMLLIKMGLTSTEPISVEGVTVKPRDVTMAVLSRLQPATEFRVEDTLEEIVTEVKGADSQGPAKVTVRALCRPNVEWGLDAGAVGTGTAIAVAASWLASRKLDHPGVHPPEAVIDAKAFFAQLETLGFETSIAVERPFRAE